MDPNTVTKSTARHAAISLGSVLVTLFLAQRGVMVPEETAQQLSGWVLAQLGAVTTVLGGVLGGIVRAVVNRQA